MLDDQLLEARIKGFYGYGNYAAPIWFVGMEEGGGGSEAEIALRLKAWDDRGRQELEDLADYHRAIGITRHFEGRPALQRTWSMLIRCSLAASGGSASTETVREVQRDAWGRSDGDTCLVEVMPLPSPSLAHWTYAASSALPYLRSRQSYVDHIASMRVNHLRRRIEEHRPRGVVFYGLKHLEWWQSIAPAKLNVLQNGALKILGGSHGGTTYLALAHPVSTGVTNTYFEQAGRMLG